MRKAFILVLALLVFIPPLLPLKIAYSQDRSITLMLNRVKPAVILVFSQIKAVATLISKEGPKSLEIEPLGGTGTGFVISPRGYIVTNGHVIQLYHEENEDQLKDYFLRKIVLKYFLTDKEKLTQEELVRQVNILARKLEDKIQLTIKKDLFVILPNGKPYPAEVKIYSPPLSQLPGKTSVPGFHYRSESGKDISILKIEERNLPVVSLGDSDEIQLGEPVYIVGYPGVVLSHPYLGAQTKFEATMTSGRISGMKLDVKGMPVIQTDAPVTWGNSGGPAFNADGKVIGVTTFISISEATGVPQAVQGFNFLVPVNTVKEFVRAAGVPLGEKSLFNQLWYEGLDLFYQKRFKEALEKFEEVNRLQKDMPDVLKMIKRIQEILVQTESKHVKKAESVRATGKLVPPKPERRSNFSFSIIIALVGLVVVVGITTILFITKLKSREKTEPSKNKLDFTPAPDTGPIAKKLGILVGEFGPISGQTFEITSTGLKIGRDSTKNDIVLDNNKVSREHAWVGPENDEIIIKDLGSTNGTFINSTDNQIMKHTLQNGDLIIIGKGRFAALRFKKV